MNAITSIIARLRGTTAAAPTPPPTDESFVRSWLKMWTANGGSVTFDHQDPDKVWIGQPMYDLSPQFKADEERRAMQLSSLSEEARRSLADHIYTSSDGFYTGKMRGLYDLLAEIPGGTAALKAVLRQEPWLGYPPALPEEEPLGWDDLLADYRAKAEAEQQERFSGRYRQALDEYNAAWPEIPPADDARRNDFEAAYARHIKVEERHEKEFLDPASDALAALLEFPAPDRAALLEKIDIADAEYDLNDAANYIVADVRRLLAPTQVDGGAWEEALAEYRAKRAISDAIDTDEPGCDEAVDAYCEAMDHLIENVPAPDGEALKIKIQLALERGHDGVHDEHFAAIAADALRLAGAEG